MRKIALLVIFAGVFFSASLFGQSATGKKVLFVDSYHSGYEWSDGILRGLKAGLQGSGVVLDVFHMDTKNNPADDFKKQAGLKAKAHIEQTKPNLVIVADDNATNYLLMPFYKNAALPFLFVGINWEASAYGLPYSNATGMLEVALVSQLVANLKEYAKGDRVGFITGDSETERKELKSYKEILKLQFASEKFVKTFAEWKDEYKKMAGSVDMILFGNNAGIKDWNQAEAVKLVTENAKVPTGTINDYIMPYVMIGMVKIPDEFGLWAAENSIKILKGESPKGIPMVQNKQQKLMLNVGLASKAGIVIKPALLKNATIVK